MSKLKSLDWEVSESPSASREGMITLALLSKTTSVLVSKSMLIHGLEDWSVKIANQVVCSRLDQEAAEDEDEDDFNPDAINSARDYEEVARSLPVFCVSSRAYQSLSGRLRKDQTSYPGFLEPSDTEIPHLQQHARKLTEAGRARHCRAFLNDLNQLLKSMKLWAAMDASKSLAGSERKKEAKLLGSLLQQLDKVRATFCLSLPLAAVDPVGANLIILTDRPWQRLQMRVFPISRQH